MKNAELNKTKGTNMDKTALVLLKKMWVGHNLPVGIPARAITEVLDTSNNE